MEEQKKTQVLGATFYGSVTFNGPMFDIHDNANVHIHSETQSAPKKKPKTEAGHLPDLLCTPQAEELLEKLCGAGLLDKQWQPIGLSLSEKGTLIEYMAEELGIRSKWKFFASFWHADSETLRTANVRGLEQNKTWDFRNRLKALKT